MNGHLLLVTGGARSGKSRYALGRARMLGGAPLFVATGVATDDEMAARIARHRVERPADWSTLEVCYGLANSIAASLGDRRAVIIDDLATLVSNLLVERAASEDDIRLEVSGLLKLRRDHEFHLVVVTNEVGLGLVPTSPLGRQFRDLLGLANQLVAAEADEVVLLIAGLPLALKS